MGVKASKTEEMIWQRHLESFKAGGLTRKAYCKKKHIQVYQLDYLRKKLSQTEESQKKPSATQWVPVHISEDPADRDSSINLWIGTLRIEVRQGFDAGLLAEIIRAAGEGC